GPCKEGQMRICLRRREFIAGLGGAAAWPLIAHAQQGNRGRRIGILLSSMSDDPVFQTWVGAFLQGLAVLGWFIGRDVDIRRHSQELVALAPVGMLAPGGSTVGTLRQLNRSIPIVFPVITIQSAPGTSRAWRGPAAT